MDIRRFSLFGNPHDDVQLLSRWRNARLTYRAGQPLPNAHTDHYEEVVATSAGQVLFNRAADLLLRYEFYPDDIMVHTSDFSVEGHHMCVGDRIVQRIRALRLFSRPIVDVLTMNEVVEVIDEPRCAGFAYATTQKHDEIGQWSAQVDWCESGELMLIIHSFGWPNVPNFMQGMARRTQLRAHQRGIANFRKLLAS